MGFVAYYRVSTKGQGESGLGLDAQKAYVKHYYPKLIGEYVEIGSGSSLDKRIELEKAIRNCIDGDHSLVVAKVDRLSRKTEDALDIYSRLDGRLVSCDIPNLDKFTLTIFMAIADRERELISIRTKAALAAAKKRGTVLGNPEHLTDQGRQRGAKIQHQTAVSQYRSVADHIKLLRERGLSFDKIAKHLNDLGMSTRTGADFHPMTVQRIAKRAGIAP